MLVLDWESRRGEMSKLSLPRQNKDQLPRACSVGKAQFDASRRGKNSWKSYRDKNVKHEP